MATICSCRTFMVPGTPPAVRRRWQSAPRPIQVALPPRTMRRTTPILRRRSINHSETEETLGEKKGAAEGDEKGKEVQEAVTAEIRERVATKKQKPWRAVELLGGVFEEVREIEWPDLGKVVGTTGAVLAVIVFSSVALLTVNALLAELSDSVFAGSGVHDFFSG